MNPKQTLKNMANTLKMAKKPDRDEYQQHLRLVLLGIAGAVLGPTVPVLLGLAAAMFLIGVGALALGTSVVSKTAAMSTIDDVFFVFSKRIKDKIDALDMWNFFGEFLSKYDFEWRPDSHNLWTNPIIDDLDENIKLAVPDIIGFTRTSERETEELRYKAYWDKYERTYGKPVIGKASCDPW